MTLLTLLATSGLAAQGNVSAVDNRDGPDRADAERTPLQTVIPEYPRAAWLDQIEGDVLVCFSVTRSGRPYNIAVRRSDYKFFSRPARDAVKASWFERIPDGEKVPPVKTCRTFQFRLEPLDPLEVDNDSEDAT
jgi:TonB family protein